MMTHISGHGEISQCKRCGTCCSKGGPVLHKEDKEILLEGHVRRELLITIRKGEWAFNPLTGRPEPAKSELIKLAGKGGNWACCLYSEEKSNCTIYDHRLLECRLLRCWDTAELLMVIGNNNLTRSDLIREDDPVFKFIALLEKECPLDVAEDLISTMQQGSESASCLSRLTALCEKDLALRSRAVNEFGLSLGDELFFFGRPLFKILGSRGVRVQIK